MIGGLAGALLINQTSFVSPAVMDWRHSGYLVVMVVVGGAGSLFGPSFGAAAVLILEEGRRATEYWPVIAGLLPFAVIQASEQFKGVPSLHPRHRGRVDISYED
jgi:branched-chain amino acid transport system permease protein